MPVYVCDNTASGVCGLALFPVQCQCKSVITLHLTSLKVIVITAIIVIMTVMMKMMTTAMVVTLMTMMMMTVVTIVVAVVAVVMVSIMILMMILPLMTLKGAVNDFLQSTHETINCNCMTMV